MTVKPVFQLLQLLLSPLIYRLHVVQHLKPVFHRHVAVELVTRCVVETCLGPVYCHSERGFTGQSHTQHTHTQPVDVDRPVQW